MCIDFKEALKELRDGGLSTLSALINALLLEVGLAIVTKTATRIKEKLDLVNKAKSDNLDAPKDKDDETESPD